MVQDVKNMGCQNGQSVKPVWTAVVKLADVLPHQKPLILHAGPPFESAKELPNAVLNSVLVGILYEGWASNQEEALAFLESGQAILAPAQDYDVVVPLAGVVTPSMYVIEISDEHNPLNKKYAVLNEGMSLCTRLGIFNNQMVPHLQWLHQELGNQIATHFQRPIDLAPILQAALLNGDDGHARTMYGSKLLADIIIDSGVNNEKSREFLYGAMAWALNYWMAASALILSSPMSDNSIVAVGGNGLRFGLKLAKQPNVWLTAKAPTIQGRPDSGNEHAQALGTIGDSAVVDFVGLGGQCLDLASLTAKNLIAFLPQNYLTRQASFLSQKLDFLGGRLGIADFERVVQSGEGPLVLLGMIDSSGEHGRIGGGVAIVDASLLEQLEAWQNETTMV